MKPLDIRQLYTLTHLCHLILIRPRTHSNPHKFWAYINNITNHYIIQKDPTSSDVGSLHGGGLGIRTLATVTRPNDLANRPLQPLE